MLQIDNNFGTEKGIKNNVTIIEVNHLLQKITTRMLAVKKTCCNNKNGCGNHNRKLFRKIYYSYHKTMSNFYFKRIRM